jgi:hypothetical protein
LLGEAGPAAAGEGECAAPPRLAAAPPPRVIEGMELEGGDRGLSPSREEALEVTKEGGLARLMLVVEFCAARCPVLKTNSKDTFVGGTLPCCLAKACCFKSWVFTCC